eukprot:gnl/Trimastix_PCT/1004.p1 GENE.gnl/Trimastix_PCT/1004~~gnl/Trimastix_PCT/1004.p1  ORF type:complete len:230 (-),score=59.00 gnl/Trimastix_PCT/1004:17-706(-)
MEDTPSAPAPQPQIRYDWYQNLTHVVITIFAKRVNRDTAETSIKEREFSISFPISSDRSFNLDLDLAHPIDPEQSRIEFLSTKIEVKLKKTETANWRTLESADAYGTYDEAATTTPSENQPDAQEAPQDVPCKHAYPTSRPGGARNWDALGASLDDELKTDKEQMSGDESLNTLLQQIYRDADPDTRKAMMKSFTESGGTVLSTNWSEVGQKRIKPSPPKGMEARTWSE